MTSSGMERGTKQLRNLLSKEAKTDGKNLKRAQKEVNKAEKAYAKSIKATQKARRRVDMAVKASQKTEKSLENAQHNHNNAANKLDRAERHAKETKDKESRLEQEVASYQDCLSDVHRSKIMNDTERERRKAETYIKTREGQIHGVSEDMNSDVTSGAPALTSSPVTA